MDVRSDLDLRDPDVAMRWDEVVAADPTATAFQSSRWLTTWAEARSSHDPKGRLVARAFGPEGQWAGVVAEWCTPSSADAADRCHHEVAGGRDVTDYRGPAAVGDHDDVAHAWVSSLEQDQVGTLELHGMAADAGWMDRVAAEADGRPQWSMLGRSVEDVCPVVDLRGDDATSWLDHLDGKQRQEFGRKARKLARDLGGVEVVEVPANDLAAGLDRFWSFAVDAEQDKGEFFRNPAMRGFFEAVVRDVGAAGGLRIHELVAGGMPAASMISLVWGKTWGLYNSSFDPAVGAYAPGAVLASQLATLAAGEGFEDFDFLRGDEEYKYGFGAVDRPIEQARLVWTP